MQLNSQSVPIISDTLLTEELREILATKGIQLELLPNPEVTRSPLGDPTVLAALIGAGATTLASLITLIGVIWSTRQKEKKSSLATVIEIKVRGDALAGILQGLGASSLGGIQADADRIQLNIDEAETLDLSDNPYREVLENLLPTEVEQIHIIEDL